MTRLDQSVGRDDRKLWERTMNILNRQLMVGAFLGLVVCGAASAQPVVQAELRRARTLVQARDFEAGERILEKLVQAEPSNGRAWLLLGQVQVAQQKMDAAVRSLQSAQSFPVTRSGALQELFLLHAGTADRDRAFTAWRALTEKGAFDLSGLHLRPELQHLEGDARFAVLFPKAFDDPFVEGQAVVHDWRGEGKGHEFGWEARQIGDVNGDGVADAIVSAPGNQPGAYASGLVYAYSGESGALLWIDKGEPGDQLGMGIESAGDVNADGVPDVVVGAPGVGRAYVYSGKDGVKLLTVDGGGEKGEGFGGSVSTAGDVNGDQHADILVGASGADGGVGRVDAFSGKDGRRLFSWSGEKQGDAYGSVVAGHTGTTGLLLVVGAPGAGQAGTGRVYVYRDTKGKPAFVVEADETGRALGQMFASVVGDVDADGVPDVYASDWANQALGPRTGRIYVHSGRNGKRILTLTGEGPGDGFGIGPARAGDVDGDGHDDLVIGAWQHKRGAPSGGKVYVYSGKTGQLLEAFTGAIGGETLGFDADGMADVNGDGRFDYLVTSAWSLVRGIRSGRTLVIAGTVDRADTKPE